jgi:hypothetical protein
VKLASVPTGARKYLLLTSGKGGIVFAPDAIAVALRIAAVRSDAFTQNSLKTILLIPAPAVEKSIVKRSLAGSSEPTLATVEIAAPDGRAFNFVVVTAGETVAVGAFGGITAADAEIEVAVPDAVEAAALVATSELAGDVGLAATGESLAFFDFAAPFPVMTIVTMLAANEMTNSVRSNFRVPLFIFIRFSFLILIGLGEVVRPANRSNRRLP